MALSTELGDLYRRPVVTVRRFDEMGADLYRHLLFVRPFHEGERDSTNHDAKFLQMGDDYFVLAGACTGHRSSRQRSAIAVISARPEAA